MTKTTVTIHDVLTENIIVREMNTNELADYQNLSEKALIEKEADLAKIAAKEAAQAKLAALGLTTDDLKALGL